MFTHKKSILNLLALGMLSMALVGCEQEGPAEKAGKEIDQAISQAGQELEKVGDSIQNAVRTTRN